VLPSSDQPDPHTSPGASPPYGAPGALFPYERKSKTRLRPLATAKGYLGDPFELTWTLVPHPEGWPDLEGKQTKHTTGTLYLLRHAGRIYLVVSESSIPVDHDAELCRFEPDAEVVKFYDCVSVEMKRRRSLLYFICDINRKCMDEVWGLSGPPDTRGKWLASLLRAPGMWGSATRLVTPRHRQHFIALFTGKIQ